MSIYTVRVRIMSLFRNEHNIENITPDHIYYSLIKLMFDTPGCNHICIGYTDMGGYMRYGKLEPEDVSFRSDPNYFTSIIKSCSHLIEDKSAFVEMFGVDLEKPLFQWKNL